MGCWGTGIFDDDLALDIKDLYNELISYGYNDKQVTNKVLKVFNESLDNENNSIIIYSALAVIQLSRSSLLEEVKSKTTLLIQNRSGMELWEEGKKADYKTDYRARINELNKLNKILSVAKVIEIESADSQMKIIHEYSEPPLCCVYSLTNNKGKVVFVGSTAFPKKRARYMNYINFKKVQSSKRFFGIPYLSKTKEEKFWEWFSENELNLYNSKNILDKYMQELIIRIKKIHPGLVIEIGSELNGKKTLVISADGISNLFYHVIKLTNEPKLISWWVILPFRQRLKSDDEHSVCFGDINLSSKNILFNYVKVGNKLDLKIYVKDIDIVNNTINNLVLLLLDNTIGEFDVTAKIGEIEVYPLLCLKNNEKTQTLNCLPIVVDGI